MKIYDNYNTENLRDKFVKEIREIFESPDEFETIVEEDISRGFDCFVDYSGECYIICRETGEYINWYKFTHWGRDMHMNFNPRKIKEFLISLRNGAQL